MQDFFKKIVPLSDMRNYYSATFTDKRHFGWVGFLTSNKPFNFGADAAHDPDPEIFPAECFLALHDIAAVRFVLHIADPWLRPALSEYSCIF